MKHILTLLFSCLFFIGSTNLADASLKPGEKVIGGKLVEYDRKNQQVVFYSNKHQKELTFKFESKKGPVMHFNEKKVSYRRYLSKRDDMFGQAILIYQDIKKFDKTNIDLKGYVVRYIGGVDKEFHEERNRKDPSKR